MAHLSPNVRRDAEAVFEAAKASLPKQAPWPTGAKVNKISKGKWEVKLQNSSFEFDGAAPYVAPLQWRLEVRNDGVVEAIASTTGWYGMRGGDIGEKTLDGIPGGRVREIGHLKEGIVPFFSSQELEAATTVVSCDDYAGVVPRLGYHSEVVAFRRAIGASADK